ncbi:hypothetical protein ACFE04_028935 [Oxalis oulophora]
MVEDHETIPRSPIEDQQPDRGSKGIGNQQGSYGRGLRDHTSQLDRGSTTPTARVQRPPPRGISTSNRLNISVDEGGELFLESMREEGRNLSRPYGFGSETRILLGSSSTQRSASENINASTFGSSREEASDIQT